MGMGLGGFYTQALSRDFSRDFQMRVLSIGPGVLNQADNVLITSTTLPGYQINNQVVPFMGLQFNVPGSGSFPGSAGWAVTFRCDQQLNIRQKLIVWQQSIFNAFPYEAGESVGAYGPKGFETVANVIVFDRDGKTARGMKLVGIYPVTVGDITYDTTGSGKEVTLQATLAYQWWTTTGAVTESVIP